MEQLMVGEVEGLRCRRVEVGEGLAHQKAKVVRVVGPHWEVVEQLSQQLM